MVEGVEDIMEVFPTSLDVVKPLCLEMRQHLFPLIDGRIQLGAPEGEPHRLYDKIIATFNDTIRQL